MPLEEVARDLYGRIPADFVAARSEQVAAATRAGDHELAAAIGALRKPTLTAWAVNLLARKATAELSALLSLGEALRRAQRELSGEQLRALATQRRRAVPALARRAGELAAEQGKPLSGTVIREVVQTLNAALADSETAERVHTGTLATAATYSGFGPAGPDLIAVGGRTDENQPPVRERDRRTATSKTRDRTARTAREAQQPRAAKKKADSLGRTDRQARVQHEIDRAREELGDLVEALEADRAALESARTEAERTDRALLRCEAEVERLRAELAHAEQQRRFARTAQRSAEDELDLTRRQVERAERLVRRARDRLAELSGTTSSSRPTNRTPRR